MPEFCCKLTLSLTHILTTSSREETLIELKKLYKKEFGILLESLDVRSITKIKE